MKSKNCHTGLSGQTTTNSSEVDIEGKAVEDELEAYRRKRWIVLKIVVPVLLSVAAILTISAVIVGVSACCCERNRRYEMMKGSLSWQLDLVRTYFADVSTRCSSQNVDKISSWQVELSRRWIEGMLLLMKINAWYSINECWDIPVTPVDMKINDDGSLPGNITW